MQALSRRTRNSSFRISSQQDLPNLALETVEWLDLRAESWMILLWELSLRQAPHIVSASSLTMARSQCKNMSPSACPRLAERTTVGRPFPKALAGAGAPRLPSSPAPPRRRRRRRGGGGERSAGRLGSARSAFFGHGSAPLGSARLRSAPLGSAHCAARLSALLRSSAHSAHSSLFASAPCWRLLETPLNSAFRSEVAIPPATAKDPKAPKERRAAEGRG